MNSLKDEISGHKIAKKEFYWEDLSEGITGKYKNKIIFELLKIFGPKNPLNILDVGCGSSHILKMLYEKYPVANYFAIDYDEKVIEDAKAKSKFKISYSVTDIFELSDFKERFDLIFLLDIIHEIYSFYGKPESSRFVNHELGVQKIKKAMRNIIEVLNPGGAIILTDDLLCEEKDEIIVRMKNEKIVKSVQKFLMEYIPKKIDAEIYGYDLKINSKDFCILLTQYNKISTDKMDRWSVERQEIHQYFSLNEYEEFFSQNGLEMFAITGTPAETLEEQKSDFELIKGLSDFPEKRLTMIALKNNQSISNKESGDEYRLKVNNYINAFVRKDINKLNELFSDNVELMDWEVKVSGRSEVIQANQLIFDNVRMLQVHPTYIYISGRTVTVEMVIFIDAKLPALNVVDIINYNDDGKIESIRAYKR